jgi:hypothetical protein
MIEAAFFFGRKKAAFFLLQESKIIPIFADIIINRWYEIFKPEDDEDQ